MFYKLLSEINHEVSREYIKHNIMLLELIHSIYFQSDVEFFLS